jgi:hypothetical protein
MSHRTVPVTSLHQCHQELVVGLQFPGASDSPVCGTGQFGVPPDNLVLSADSPPVATIFFVSWTLLDTC